MDFWMLLSGLAAIAVGVVGPMNRVVNPRNQRDRQAKGLLLAFALATISGGVVLAGYSILA